MCVFFFALLTKKMAARLRTLLERPGDLRPDFGPESLAILDTLQAAVHARMQDGRGVRPENLCDGASSEAVVLRAFRDAPTLREFAQLAATELLPIGAGPLMLSGGLRRSMLHRFDKVLQKKQVADTAALEVQSKRRELQTLKDEMNKTLCMAMCNTKDSKYSMNTEEGTCGGSAYGERCGHLVATLGRDGTVVASKAGIHIDTKRTKDHKTVWRSMKSVWSAFSQRFRQVGAWADDHLVEGWRNIDNKWIHLCPYHEEEIRRKNPAYWAYLVAMTALKFVVATQVKAFVNRQISDRLVNGIVGDKKELTEVDRIRLNAVLKDNPAEERKRILKDYPDLTYEGSDTPIVSKNGLLLGSVAATKVKTNMDAEHRRLAYDADGMTDADKAALAKQFSEYDGLSENTDISTASSKYVTAMKDGRIDSSEEKDILSSDGMAQTAIEQGVKNNAEYQRAKQDGYLSLEEEASLREKGISIDEKFMRKTKRIRKDVQNAVNDFDITKGERQNIPEAAMKDNETWRASEIVSGLKEKRYISEEDQEFLRGFMQKSNAKVKESLLETIQKRKNIFRNNTVGQPKDQRHMPLTEEGLPMTEKQGNMYDLAKSAMKGEKVVTPSEMKELREKIPADQWSVLGIDNIVEKGVKKYASDVERLRKEAEDGLLRRGDVRNAWFEENVADETIEHVMKDAVSLSASQTSKDIRNAMENAGIIDGAVSKGSVSESDQQKLLKRVKNKKDIVEQMGENRVTAEGLPMTRKQIKLVKDIEAASSDGVVTPDEYEKLRKKLPAKEWASLNAEGRLTRGRKKFRLEAETIRSALNESGGVITPDQLEGVSRETMKYMQKNAKSVSADPLAKRLAISMRSGNILREAGRKGYVAEADQERLKSMNPKDLKRYAESHNIVLNLAGTALNKKQYTARKVLLKTTKDGVINPVEAKKLLKKNDMLNQLNKEDTARLEQSRKNYDELERAVANEGVLDQKQTITLEDGTKLKASDALKQVSLSKNEGVKRVLKTQKQVDKLEKGKIQSLDADTLEHLRTTEKGRNIEATIVRNNPEMPAFRSLRTNRKGALMAKEEAKLADAMRKNIVDLTALQDVQKIKAAASLTEWRALDKVRKKYASQLKTVKKFQKMAGSPEAYDEMRAEVGAVGAGREDPLTEDYLTRRLSDIQEKMNYYDTHRFENVASPRERGSLAFEGLGELASDTMSRTSETGSSAYEWATRRDGDAAEWEQLVDE